MNVLAESGLGRICLHLAAMCRDGALRFHWHGILRELALLFACVQRVLPCAGAE